MDGGKFSEEINIRTTTRTLSRPHQNQTRLLSSHLISDTVINKSRPMMSSSQDQLVQRLYKEIDIRNSRIQELEYRYNQTGPCLSRLLPSLVQEIDCQKMRKVDMELVWKEKVVSLLRETDHRNMEIAELKQTCDEMCIQNRRLLQKNDMFQRLYNQEARKVQVMNLHNKRLESKLESVENELRQLMQGIDGTQKDQGQGSSEEKNEMNVVDNICAIKRELKDKKDEVQYLQNLSEILLLKEHMSNNELLDARRVLLSGLQSILTNRSALGIKRMGELNPKPFCEACALKFPEEEWGIKSAEACSLWEEYLKDSNWHPFKHTIIDGKLQEVIDEKDERLEELRKEWGEEPYKAVKTALLELNECNPSGRYPVPEIWNFKEERRASLKEVIGYLIQQVKTRKRKR